MVVVSFTYLGNKLSKDVNEIDEMKPRIKMTKKTYYSVLLKINTKEGGTMNLPNDHHTCSMLYQ